MQKRKVLVIGGGTAGMASALEAAAGGFQVYLVEKAAQLGGRAYTYCCKAVDKCAKCSACLIPQSRMNVEKSPLITVFYESKVIEVKRTDDSFTVAVEDGSGGITYLEVGVIIAATGFKPFDAAKKPEFAYGREKHVITALELEAAIRTRGSFTAAFGKLNNIGFVQCVGSRDLSLGNNYCSRVCCMYTSRLARLIRSELPEAELTVFYMDLQTFGRGFDEFVKSAVEDDNIQFVRGIPAKIFGFPYNRLTVRYANSLTGEAIEDKFDLIVLSSAITPGEDTENLSTLLSIDYDEHGFFKSDVLNPVGTKQHGIFIAGACQSPKDIQQSMVQAKAAASAAIKYLVTK